MRLIDADELIVMEYGGIKFVPKEFIDDAPTIEPERKTGRWIEDKEASKAHVEKIYRCSSCNNFEAWGATELYNYCPNCGAMMGVEHEVC